MKSLKEISLNLPECEYHNLPAWSYSLIAKYARDGFQAIRTMHDKTKPTASMRFGSLVDCMITRPEEFDGKYIVATQNIPESIKSAYNLLLNDVNLMLSGKGITDADLLRAADVTGFQPRWKQETRLERLKAFSWYYKAIATGQEFISNDDYNSAYRISEKFCEDKQLSALFGRKDENGKEFIYQAQFVKPFYLSAGRMVDMKMMADLIVVNHTEKTVQLVDLKTSSEPAYLFVNNFLKYRYDIQAAVYTDVLRKVLDETDGYDEYSILPFLFAVVSKTDEVPVVFRYTPDGPLSYMKKGTLYSYKEWPDYLSEILDYEESHAEAPSWISLSQPNDIEDLLNQ